MHGPGKGRLLFAQRADVDRYPPALHQVRLLGASYDRTVVDCVGSGDPDDLQTAQEVQRLRVREARADGPLPLLRRVTNSFAFARSFKRQLATEPDVVIAYDVDAAAILLRASRALPARHVVHLHELVDLSTVGRSTRLAARYVMKNLSHADLVIVPDADRARIVASDCSLTKAPLVVMNCPQLIPKLPESRLIPALQERGIVTSNIVHYQGAIGPDHHLDTIVASMPRWPNDAVFVMVGSASDEYRRQLQAHADSLGVGDRVIWLGRLPYRDLFSYAIGAAVGLTFLEPTTDNWRFSAGASNKRFEYAALGIAQVTNSGAGMDETFGKPGLATLLDHLTPQSMGDAIEALLSDPSQRAEMGERARRAHLLVNNYEAQFAPVIAQLDSWRGVGA